MRTSHRLPRSLRSLSLALAGVCVAAPATLAATPAGGGGVDVVVTDPFFDCDTAIDYNNAPDGASGGVLDFFGHSASERFMGQTRVEAGNFDTLAGTPDGPLILAAGPFNQNVGSPAGTNKVLGGIGPQGFPAGFGKGALALLLDSDQDSVEFFLIPQSGADAGTVTVTLYRRDGLLIDQVGLPAPESTKYRLDRVGGVRDIAGLTFENTAPGGVAVDLFCYDIDPSPAMITGVSPVTGFAGGFTQVSVTGTGLGGGEVSFGGAPALETISETDIELVVLAPGGPLGQTVDVSVTDDNGTSTLVGAYTFVENPPLDVSGVSPAFSNVAGGGTVTLSGPYLAGVTGVSFGGEAGSGLTLVNATTLDVTVPPQLAAGPVDVSVTDGGPPVVLAGGFTYYTPGFTQDIGPGLQGEVFTPTLSLFGEGDLFPGDPAFNVVVGSAKPSARGLLLASTTQGAVPFFGGTLYTDPIVLDFNIVADVFGIVTFPVDLPDDLPSGFEVVLQAGFIDTGATFGVSLSNGLLVHTAEF